MDVTKLKSPAICNRWALRIDISMNNEILESGETEGGFDEPPEPPSNIHCWCPGMVARLAPYLSVRTGGNRPFGLDCFYRKHLGVMGTVEFYPQ